MYLYKLYLLFASVMITPAAPYNKLKGAVIDFDDWYQGNLVRLRFQDMTRAFYEEGMQRIKRLNHIRLKYEETPYFEMGYVIGEVIEKYRKQVELVKYMHDYKSEILFRRMAQLNMILNVYLETYHFHNMFNEIPRKYAYIPEFKEVSEKFDKYIEGLDQTCDEYDSKCRTDTQMGDVFKSITEERERELQRQKNFKKKLKKYREKFLQAYVNGTLEQLKNESFAGAYDPMYKPPGHIAQGESVFNIYANNDKVLNDFNRLKNTSLWNDYYYMLGKELERLKKLQDPNKQYDPYHNKPSVKTNITKPKPISIDYFLPKDDIYWKKERGPGNLVGVKRPQRPKQRRPFPVEYGWSKEDVYFQGWDKDQPDENTTFIYSMYKPPTPPSTTTKRSRTPSTAPTTEYTGPLFQTFAPEPESRKNG